MTREEKQKAIDALKISAPVMVVTQEKFNDYIQTLNKVMDWLEQEPCEDAISRQTEQEITKEKAHWIMPVQDDGMSDPICYQVRCSKCGFDLDPQTWHQELHQYGADKYCPNCGALMKTE